MRQQHQAHANMSHNLNKAAQMQQLAGYSDPASVQTVSQKLDLRMQTKLWKSRHDNEETIEKLEKSARSEESVEVAWWKCES